MKKCIVISDSFKGSLSSGEICDIARACFAEVLSDCELTAIPVADGGEGTVDCFHQVCGGELVPVTVQGPFGQDMEAAYLRLDGGRAVIEMASSAGLPLVGDRRDPRITSTYGVGQQIRHAVEQGSTQILLGLGGSATNDGGCGAAAALGVEFYDRRGRTFVPTGGTLGDIHRICAENLEPLPPVTVLCDVDNPLCGPRGAAAVFGPQKGADPDMVQLLDAGLAHLAAVLRRGTVSCPDMGALSRKMDDLYDASIDYTVRKKGENQCIGFVASFIDDRYAPGGERLLEPAAALLGELICDPVTYHGRFVPEYFESEKTNLLEAIRSLINDKRDWADSRLLRALCDGEAYAVPRLGDEETVDKLQALKVYTQYRDLISTAPLEIIYSGSAELERVKQALAAAFATLPREEVRVISTAAPHVCRESVQHVEDVLDVTQGKLGMGFSCGSDDMPALLMGNTLFGGSSNSKLFLNVREKLSLCYYASSLYHRQKGLITVSSGIEFQNYQRAYDEIMAQLEAVQKGELEDWELEGARSTLLNNYATVGDSQGKLENFYLGQAATGQHETPADLARAIQDMTAERICRAMSTVKLDTVYFLKGKEGEA